VAVQFVKSINNGDMEKKKADRKAIFGFGIIFFAMIYTDSVPRIARTKLVIKMEISVVIPVI
jgi:hypothetical protein